MLTNEERLAAIECLEQNIKGIVMFRPGGKVALMRGGNDPNNFLASLTDLARACNMTRKEFIEESVNNPRKIINILKSQK